MQSAKFRLVAIIGLIAAMLSPIPLAGPMIAMADEKPFVVANAASFQPNPVASGALWAIFTPNRVSPEQSWNYRPWTTTPHRGLRVQASCTSATGFVDLPVLFVGFAYGGNQINVYKPNAIGDEPWGNCPYTGPSTIRIQSADGGPMLQGPVILLPAHPGIFTVGQAPSGDHVDGDGNHTVLSSCPILIKTSPKACTVRDSGGPGQLWLYLTGAEWFLCDPCTTGDIRFELAPAPDAPESAWVPQNLRHLAHSPTGIGVEQAMITLRSNTAPGVYYLRVRNTFRPEYPTPLRVELGQPSL